MLPSPAITCWSVSRAFSCCRRDSTMRAKSTHSIGSSSGSQPSSAKSGASSASLAGSTTKTSPKVRGSTKRSWLPWVKSTTTWVCFGFGALGVDFSSCPLMRRWMTNHSPESRTTMMYLPLRLAVLNVRPARRLASCAFVPRRTLRTPVTCTDLTFFPANSRSRSRRTVSTSGSSGMSGGMLLLQTSACFSGGGLLRLLLRPSLALAPARRADHHRGEEPLLVVGALFANEVHRRPVEQASRELLQRRLVVEHGQPVDDVIKAVPEQSGEHVAHRVGTAVDVDGADHGLERVGQD